MDFCLLVLTKSNLFPWVFCSFSTTVVHPGFQWITKPTRRRPSFSQRLLIVVDYPHKQLTHTITSNNFHQAMGIYLRVQPMNCGNRDQLVDIQPDLHQRTKLSDIFMMLFYCSFDRYVSLSPFHHVIDRWTCDCLCIFHLTRKEVPKIGSNTWGSRCERSLVCKLHHLIHSHCLNSWPWTSGEIRRDYELILRLVVIRGSNGKSWDIPSIWLWVKPLTNQEKRARWT